MIALLALAVCSSGCGSHPADPLTGIVTGTLTEFSDGAPLAGARVVLIDPITNGIAATARSDAAGRFQIDGVAPGRYYAAASLGRFIAFETRDDALDVQAGQVTRQDFRLGDYPYLDPDLPPVSGRVLDAATGRPIEGAYVSVGDSDLAALFSGIAAPWEILTDAEGRFELPFVPFFADAHSGTLLGLYPVMATHPGYAPAATGSVLRRQFLPLPFPPGSSTTVELRLRPNPASGVLRGRVLHEGRGIADIPVGLSLVDTASVDEASGEASAPRRRSTLAPRAVMTGLTARTDSEGGFAIRGIPPGRYRAQAAYWPDDGWAMPTTGGEPNAGLFAVTAGSETELTISVLPALRLLEPLPGSAVSTGRPLLKWSGVPAAEFYRVRFSNADSYLLTNTQTTPETFLVGPVGLWGDGDWVRWAVEAYRGDKLVAVSDVIFTFVVRSRGGPGL